MKTAIIKYYNIIPSIDTQKKEDQVILVRSPDFCLKPKIHRYISKTVHAPGDPLVGPFLSLDRYLIKLKYGPLTDTTY